MQGAPVAGAGRALRGGRKQPRPKNAPWPDIGGHPAAYYGLSVADGTTLLDPGQMNPQNSDRLEWGAGD